jgi:hypothetical protein
MGNIKSLFLVIDRELFKQVDLFKSSQLYQKSVELTRSLPESNQKIINQLLTFIFLAAPFIPAAVLLFNIYNTKQSIAQKEEALTAVRNFQAANFEADRFSKILPKSRDIKDEASFKQSLGQMLSSTGIKPSNVTMSSYHLSGSIIPRSDVALTFKQFTIGDLESFTKSWTTRYRAKISKLKIKSDTKKDLLRGEVELIILGQKRNEIKK